MKKIGCDFAVIAKDDGKKIYAKSCYTLNESNIIKILKTYAIDYIISSDSMNSVLMLDITSDKENGYYEIAIYYNYPMHKVTISADLITGYNTETEPCRNIPAFYEKLYKMIADDGSTTNMEQLRNAVKSEPE